MFPGIITFVSFSFFTQLHAQAHNRIDIFYQLTLVLQWYFNNARTVVCNGEQDGSDINFYVYFL